jgi:hypothetical protein
VCLHWHKGSDLRAYILQGMATCGKLGYAFRFREKFDEPNDDWLKCIKATSDELLGAYSKAKDNAPSAAFGNQGKKRFVAEPPELFQLKCPSRTLKGSNTLKQE